MHILLAHNSLYYPSHGGGDKSNRLLMEALSARGHEVRVVARIERFGPGPQEEFLRQLALRGITPEMTPPEARLDLSGVDVRTLTLDPHLRVFLSSHILTEIQHSADRVAILAGGRSVAAGPVAEVLSAGRAQGVLVRVRDLVGGMGALHEAGFEAALRDHVIRVTHPSADADRVSRALADRGFYPMELRPDEADLETVFLELTSSAGKEKR